jgi:hypothetical protein
MILRDIEIMPATHLLMAEFSIGIQYIVDLYLACLDRVKTDSFNKVIVQFHPEKDFMPKTQPLLTTAIVGVAFDFDQYWPLQTEARAKIVLDKLQEGLLQFARDAQFNAKPFEDAYQRVMSKNIQNIRTWGKPKSNPKRTLKADIRYEMLPFKLRLFAVIYDSQGNEIYVKHFANLLPNIFAPYFCISSIKWEDEKTIIVTSSDKTCFWRVDVSKALGMVIQRGNLRELSRAKDEQSYP